MNRRFVIDQIDSSIKSLEEEANSLNHRVWELSEERQKHIALLIKEDKMLEGSEWDLRMTNAGKLFLNYNGDFAFSQAATHKLVWSGWHCSFELAPGVSLALNDGDADLYFTDVSLVDFAKEYGLKIVSASISERAEMLKQQYDAMEKVLKEIGK